MDSRRLYNDIQLLKRKIVDLEMGEVRLEIDFVSGQGQFQGELLVCGTGSHEEVSGSHIVFLDDTENWRRACAGNKNSGSAELVGIAVSDQPHTNGVLVKGLFNISSSYVSGSSGHFATGSQVFISPHTSGSLTTTLPSGSGEIVRVIGHAINATTLYVSPSPDNIEV